MEDSTAASSAPGAPTGSGIGTLPPPEVGSARIFPHLASAARRTSGLDSATGGKSFIHSYGRHASITARELCPRSAIGMMGSSEPLQLRRMISISASGLDRVVSAHRTSLVLVTSMSSSTTMVYRPRYAPAWQYAAIIPACRAWPG